MKDIIKSLLTEDPISTEQINKILKTKNIHTNQEVIKNICNLFVSKGIAEEVDITNWCGRPRNYFKLKEQL